MANRNQVFSIRHKGTHHEKFVPSRRMSYIPTYLTGRPHKQCVCLCSKYNEMYGRILKSLNIVNLYRGMSTLKLKINVKVPQLLCIVVSVALNFEFERFGGFCV